MFFPFEVEKSRAAAHGQALMRITPKPLLAVVTASGLAALTTTGAVFAADYSVAYALQAGGKTETGKIESCNSINACHIKFRTIDATADLSYFPEGANKADIVLSVDGDSACCYFSDGNSTVSLDPAKRLHTLTIYAGHARRGNEVIQNQEVGVLYLSFAMSP